MHLRAEFAFLALQELGPVIGFSLNLSPEIEALARSQASPLDWLHRRVRRELKAALGPSVPFLMAIEETDDHRRRLHLHGVLQLDLTTTRPEIITGAFRRAGGEWPKARQHQVKLTPSPDAGWISYALKDAWKTTPFMRRMLATSTLRVRFRGDVLSATADVWRAARLSYSVGRKLIVRGGAQPW
ncbi:hypothetical protein [Enterovirga aerilata]|uniref:Replication endonuclease n=1 Tax=Enterovirga aerilata TaxID=2730920 RepID=A0A849I8I3_9HYPH|nr:hypothetical protein [Enterovirga sp. DB1703]NNM72719.1 hypothetical protein [Enterovirga sp. DB1703]